MAAATAARPRPAQEELDRGSGPPAGSSADVGKPGRLTAPVRAGQDRVDRVAGELAPSAAGRAGYVWEAVGTSRGFAGPSGPANGTMGRRVPAPAGEPTPGPLSPGTGPPGSTGGASPTTGPVTGALLLLGIPGRGRAHPERSGVRSRSYLPLVSPA